MVGKVFPMTPNRLQWSKRKPMTVKTMIINNEEEKTCIKIPSCFYLSIICINMNDTFNDNDINKNKK